MKYALVFLAAVLTITSAQFYGQPEQVHLSYGGKPSRMIITWATKDATNDSHCTYGEKGLTDEINAMETWFNVSATRKLYIHRCTLQALKADTNYVYRVGGKWGWSAIYYFHTLPLTSETGYRFAVYGDLGSKNPRSLSMIQDETQLGHFDMILHNGDFGYDMRDNDGEIGDQFMRQIEPIAAYVPYMTTVGNHEAGVDFNQYRNRFTMPNGGAENGNLYYSFDVGFIHFIMFSSEMYYYDEPHGIALLKTQYEWIVNDLKLAVANRAHVPWIITLAHRPMYCSDDDGDDCTKYASRIRSGMPITGLYGLEKVFYDNGVDLAIWAHEHSYERLWPVFNRTIYNGTQSAYTNPLAPVHIITGSAGCQELTDPFILQPNPWSAFRSSEYGYTRMHVLNTTHLHIEQVSEDMGGAVIDDIMVIREKHEAYNMTNLGYGHYVSEEWRAPQKEESEGEKKSHLSDF